MFKVNCPLLLLLITLKYNVNAAWSGYGNLGGGLDHVVAASWGPGRRDVFGVINKGMYQKAYASATWSDSFGRVREFGFPDSVKKPGAFSMKENTIEVMVTGSDKKMYRLTWNGSVFSGWMVDPTNSNFVSGPALTATDTTYLHVFGVGVDGMMYHTCVNVITNGWSNWEQLGGGCVGDPAAASRGNKFDVFTMAVDGSIYQKTYDGGWKPWAQVPSTIYFNQAGVGAVAAGLGVISVFARGLADNALYHIRYENGKWNKEESLGGSIISSPSAVSPLGVETRIDVFAVGPDQRIYYQYMDTAPIQERLQYGCSSGMCWAECSGGLAHQSCFTTRGSSMDGGRVYCENVNQCAYSWSCGGLCLVDGRE